MEHVDYQEWAAYIQALCQRHQVNLNSVLEIGAGTCPFSNEPLMKQAGLVVYSDISYPMLNQANKPSTPLKVNCDGSQLPFKKQFDFCLMIYDTFNHFLKIPDARDGLQNIYQVLNAGGHFLFDVTTEYNSKAYFLDTIDYEESQAISLVRESWYEEKTQLQNNLFTYFIKDKEDRYQKVKESHQQRIYPTEQILDLIDKTGFTLVNMYNDISFEEPGQNCERIHFLLKK